jgi:DNA-binding MarR family transcriptional regulator
MTTEAAESAKERFSYRSWPFYWLTRAHGRYLANMEAVLRPTGLDAPSWRVLMTLHEDNRASVSEIAEHSNTKLSTMAKIVHRMAADDLVACTLRPTDARVTEVTLTREGERAGDDAWRAANVVYERAFRGLTRAEMATLNRLLEKVADNLKPG